MKIAMPARRTAAPAFALSACALAVAQAWAQSPAASEAAATPEVKLEEVVVTAQKVAQPASKTPISMSVITGDALKAAGTNDARALTDIASNVQVGVEVNKLQIAIRGVLNTDNTEKGDPSTAFHVDGVYIGRAEAQTGSFMDLERIEVLRGPQGTLYGRNATAGAVNLITNKPTQLFGGKFTADIGNYGTRRAEGMLNLPVNETLALRGVVAYNKRDSYLNPGPQINVPLESQDDYAARLHALFTLSPTTSWLLTAETSHQGGDGSTPVPLTNFFTGTSVSNGNNLLNPVYVDRGSSEQRTVYSRFVRPAHTDNTHSSLRSEFKTNVGFADLTYQVGYLNSELDYNQNGTFFSFPFWGNTTGSTKQMSHEVRLNSNKPGALRWLVGGYLFREDIERSVRYNTVTPGPTITLAFEPRIQNRSKALFGQTTYSLSDSLRLITGLRYTQDKKGGIDPFAGTAGPGYDLRGDAATSFHNINYRVGLDYDLTKATFLYGAVATGYKAGGFNADATATRYRPEELRSIALGAKSRQMGGRLQLNAEVFFYDYKDMQNASTVCTGNTSATCGSRVVNVGPVKSRGLDFDGQYLITDNGRLNFALGLLKTEFKDFTAVQATTTTAAITFNGQPTDRSPERTLRLGYSHTFPFESGAQVVAYAGTRLSSSYYISDPSAGIRYQQPSFHKSDAHVTYRTADDKHFVQVYVKNIENEITIESRVPSSLQIGDPRTFGVRFGTQF